VNSLEDEDTITLGIMTPSIMTLIRDSSAEGRHNKGHFAEFDYKLKSDVLHCSTNVVMASVISCVSSKYHSLF
jgi:hypothetical protein